MADPPRSISPLSRNAGSLKPVLPSWNRKYIRSIIRGGGRDGQKIPALTRISSLLESGSESQLVGWECLTHPEGNWYWYNAEKRLITPNNPHDSPALLELLLDAHKRATQLLTVSGELDATIEVFANFEGDPALAPIVGVEYYLIDHQARQIFWAEEVDVAKMGLEPFGREGALKSILTPEYWTHVEYFPAHRDCDIKAETELMNILRHGCIDDLTAPGSISPYGSSQCFEFLKIFEGFKSFNEAGRDGYRTVSLARLWASIARIRHIHSFGLPNARLDRFQGLPEFIKSQTKSSLALAFWEAICFYIPRRIFRRLSALWNGRVVYERHWTAFFEEMKRDWLVMGGLGLALWITGAVVLALGGTNLAVMASASFAVASVLISLLLLQGHKKNRLATAPQLSSYIVQVEDYHHGLRPLSFVFSLPHALTIYSAVLLQVGLFHTSAGNADLLNRQPAGLMMALWVLPVVVPAVLAVFYGGTGVL